MNLLGGGLSASGHHEDALSVHEARLSLMLRVGASEDAVLYVKSNLASSYAKLGQVDKALSIERDVYFGWAKLHGEEHRDTLRAAFNYSTSLSDLERFEETKELSLKTMPVMRRVLGEGNEIVLKMRGLYAKTLYEDSTASLDDLREAVTTLEETARIAQRVLGGAHPTTVGIEEELRDVRAALRARETGLAEALADMRV